MTENPDKPLGQTVVRGAVWMVAMRWLMRGIGFINIALLARLLAPYDFGMVALALPLLGILMGIMDVGARIALVRHPHATDTHYHTFWTIGIIQASLCCLGMLIAAPFAVDFYNEPAVFELFVVLGASTLLRAFENGYVVALQKDMHFGKDFAYNTSVTVIRVGITIGLAFYLRDYRALLYGHLAGSIAQVVISYLICGNRMCRFSLKAFDDLWGVSKWLFVQNLGILMSEHIDRLMLGRLTSLDKLGGYTVAAQIAALPFEVLLAPLSRVIQPAYSKKSEAGESLSQAFLFVLSGLSHISSACYIGLALVAEPFISLVFGTQWLEAVPYVVWFALILGVISLTNPIRAYWIGIKFMKLPALVTVINGVLLVAGIVPAFNLFGIIGIIYWRMTIVIIETIIRITLLHHYQGIDARQILMIIIRPVMAAVFMAGIILLSRDYIQSDSAFLTLALNALLGAFSYVIGVILVWNLLGRPDGAERWVLEIGRKKLRTIL